MKKRLPIIIAVLLVILVGLNACTDSMAAALRDPAETYVGAISREEAQEIALKHAGLTPAEADRLQIRMDYEDGQPVYDVEFRYGRTEYEYEIHADSGKILSVDIDDE